MLKFVCMLDMWLLYLRIYTKQKNLDNLQGAGPDGYKTVILQQRTQKSDQLDKVLDQRLPAAKSFHECS